MADAQATRGKSLIMTHSGEWFRAQALNSIHHGMGTWHAINLADGNRSAYAADWIGIDRAIAGVAVPRGYRLELLRRSEIPELIGAIRNWFPAIDVGSASCYSRASFLQEKVYFPEAPHRDVLIILI